MNNELKGYFLTFKDFYDLPYEVIEILQGIRGLACETAFNFFKNLDTLNMEGMRKEYNILAESKGAVSICTKLRTLHKKIKEELLIQGVINA